MSDTKIIFSTKVVEEIREKADEGFKISRDDKYWFDNNQLVRKQGLIFSYTDDELIQFAICKMGLASDGTPYRDPKTQTLEMTGVQYFAENYCKIKNEQGKINNIRLRDYQKEILDMYMANRYSILMASRQTGKCETPFVTIDTKKGKISVYKIWFKMIKMKKLSDYIKYCLYSFYSMLK